MQKILLLICLLFVMACTSDEIKEDKDYYSPVKSQLKEYIIPTKCQDIRICLPDSFSAYQGIADLSGVDGAIEELWYKSNRNDCSIHIMILRIGKSLKEEEIVLKNINNIKVENPEALIYTKRLTNDSDTIYYLNFIGRQEDVVYINQICYIIKNNILYSVTLYAERIGSVIDLELYDEIMNSVRIVD